MLFLLYFIIIGAQSLELKLCSEITSTTVEICNNGKEWEPWIVESFLGLLDISEVNEEKKSITIQLQVILEWFNNKIGFVGPLANETDYYEIPNILYDASDIRNPNLMFIKSKSTEVVELFGSIKYSVPFYYLDTAFKPGSKEPVAKFHYSQYVKIEMGCHFKFKDYPYDKDHQCIFKYFCPAYDNSTLILAPSKIFQPNLDL